MFRGLGDSIPGRKARTEEVIGDKAEALEIFWRAGRRGGKKKSTRKDDRRRY